MVDASREFEWTCGGDTDLIYQCPLGSGGFGEVHGLLRGSVNEVIARKVIRSTTRASKKEIENEARVVMSICEKGGAKNIIRIFGHGWLPGAFQVYFIDMERATWTLADYIEYLRGDETRVDLSNLVRPLGNPIPIVERKCSIEKRFQNIWFVGLNIAQGLEFMHMHNHAHRDLKPNNVLYCLEEGTWKLTDFGLSSDATSLSPRTTVYSRGSPSYRAPEILAEPPSFTNKVDIWGLGCILFELGTLRKAFADDWAVIQYKNSSSYVVVCEVQLNETYRIHFEETIMQFLDKAPQKRPAARELSRSFAVCCEIIDLELSKFGMKEDSMYNPLFWKNDALFAPWLSPFISVYRYAKTLPNFVISEQEWRLNPIWVRLADRYIERPSLKGRYGNFQFSLSEDEEEAILKDIGEHLSWGSQALLLSWCIALLENLNPFRFWVLRSVAEILVRKGDFRSARWLYFRFSNMFPEHFNFLFWVDFWDLVFQFQTSQLTQHSDDASQVTDYHRLHRFKDMLPTLQNKNLQFVEYNILLQPPFNYELSITEYISEYKRDYPAISTLLPYLTAFIQYHPKSTLSPRLKAIERTRLASNLKENPHYLKHWLIRNVLFLSFPGSLNTLLYACWVGNVWVVQRMLSDNNTNPLQMEYFQFGRDEFELTSLHLAVWNLHHDVAELLLQHDATVFARSPKAKFTALHLAVFNNDIKMVTILLEAGALVSIMDTNGETSLDWAIRYTTNESLIQIMVEFASFEPTWNINALKSTIQLAIHVENTEALNILLKLLASCHPSWKWWDILRKRGIEESPEETIKRLEFISKNPENLSIQDSSGYTFGECIGIVEFAAPSPN